MDSGKETEVQKKPEGREKAGSQKKLVYLVVVLAALILVVWFVFSGDAPESVNDENAGNNLVEGTTGNSVVVTVNGEEITLGDVDYIQQSFARQGQQIPAEEVVEQLINQEVVSQRAEVEGFVSSDADAEAVIAAQISSQGATLDDYKSQLSQLGVSYQSQLDYVKEQLVIQDYVNNEFEGQSFNVSEEEASDFYELYAAQFSEEGAPSFEELEAQIVFTLQEQKKQEAIGSLIQELRAEAEIEYS